MTSKNPPMEFLRGPRVVLCPLRKEDSPQFARWMNDAETANFLMFHRPLSLEEEEEWVNKALHMPITEGAILGIWLHSPFRLVGSIGLHSLHSRDRHATLGISIGEANLRGKRLGREAMSLLIDYAFRTLNLRRVILWCYGHNERAIRCYRAVGFQEAGRLERHSFINGEWQDYVLMEITPDRLKPLVAEEKPARRKPAPKTPAAKAK